MSTMGCDDSSLFGAQQIDQTHRHLMELLNELCDVIRTGSLEPYQTKLDELIEYAIYHFICEEYWMNKNLYPGHWDHKKEHEVFFHKIAEISKTLGEGNILLTLDKISFLTNWLTEHKFDSDANYRVFIATGSMEAE